ncbi:MAG: chitobiase/beta-hexosaminidase C-terminal domain-containing protein [Candidatus Thorarchaeota archaeon]
MATISITITESPLQLVAGIPSNITLSTNVPSTIFYTLNGSEPTITSNVAVGSIDLPRDITYIVLKAFATDGVDTSAVITQEYKTDITSGRNPHDKITNYESGAGKATYPFGSPAESFNVPTIFGNTGGIIYDDGQAPRSAGAYDGADGYGDFYTPPASQYDYLFSETNAIGERGRGIGTLPARVLSVRPRNDNDPAESSNAAGPLFDPRALVIFQDSREEQYDKDVPKINRPYFDLEDPAKARDGALLSSTDVITPQGSFLKQYYNPSDNTLTYYYYDNRVARWIISKEPYHHSQNPTINMAGMVNRSSRGQGVGLIFKWIPFKYRRLI